MSALLAGIGMKLAAGVGATAVAALIVKFGGPKLAEIFNVQLGKALSPNVTDPQEKELLADIARACIRYAEYKLPDRGGEDKKAYAVKMLSKYLPGSSAEAVGRVIQEAFDTLDDELKKKSAPATDKPL